MSRYIDAEDLRDRVEKCNRVTMHKNVIVAMILDQKTADVREVVYCKDCKYWTQPYENELMRDIHKCVLSYGLCGIVGDYDYCSYGKKKDGEEK